MNVDQYGQIKKNKMVKFVIHKNVQFETIIIIVQLRLSLWGRQCSLQTELHYTIHSFIQCHCLLFSVNIIINSITQNDLIVHSIMQVIFNQ